MLHKHIKGWSKGIQNHTRFEKTFSARQTGSLLSEAADSILENGEVTALKTVINDFQQF